MFFWFCSLDLRAGLQDMLVATKGWCGKRGSHETPSTYKKSGDEGWALRQKGLVLGVFCVWLFWLA